MNIPVTKFDQSEHNLIELYPNQALLVLFYTNNCLGCTGRAIPLAYELQKQFPEIKVIGIHSNFGTNNVTEVDIKSIFTTGELPFPIYLDPDHKTHDLFECEGTPHWLLVSKSGEIYRSFFGSQDGAQNRLSYALASLIEES